jgi:hypothetical protein
MPFLYKLNSTFFLFFQDDEKFHIKHRYLICAICFFRLYGKKKTATNAVFLGEGIFAMGYSKNYI